MQGGEHSHPDYAATTASLLGSSHSTPFESTPGGAWHPSSSSKVARLLSRSSVQPASDANRLRSLLDSTTPRRFSDQHGSGTAWSRSSDSLFATALPTGIRRSHDDTQSVGGVGQRDDGFQQAYGVSAKLPANQGYSSWQSSEEASRQGRSKAQAFLPVWSSAAQDKLSSSRQSPEWPVQTDNSMSKLQISRASFTSGMPPATTGLQAYRFEASPSHPSLFSDKAADVAPRRALGQGLKPGRQSIPRSSLISTRFSEQCSLGDVHDADLRDSLPVQRSHSETLHIAQQDSHSEQWQQQHAGVCSSTTGDLYSAVSVQPRRSRLSLLADATAKSTRAHALSEDQQPEPCFSALAQSLAPLKSLAGQSPVAVALSEDSPWHDQPGSLHLRHQTTWHMPTTSHSHIHQQQQQQQQQQPLSQHLSMLHSMQSLQSPTRPFLPKSAANVEAPMAESDIEPDSMPTHGLLVSAGLKHDISARHAAKVC